MGAQQSYSLMAVSLATAVKCLFRTQANLDNLTVKWNKGQGRVVGTQPSSGDGGAALSLILRGSKTSTYVRGP